MNEYFIDLGSSTIKVYEYDNKLTLLEEHCIYFKNDFNKEIGISVENKNSLYNYFDDLKNKYSLTYDNTNIYATGIFRNISYVQKKELVKEFNKRFDLHFNIISHGIENYYLGKAMEADYNNKKVMIVNMGGKTTELITFDNNIITKRYNLNIGVSELLNKFPKVNDEYSSVQLEEMVEFTKECIRDVSFDTDYDCAIFTGGEKRFELLTKYNLVENTLFNDGIHEYMVSMDDFIKGNKRVFFDITLKELYDLMPYNPKWMDGARAGTIIPQAIFEIANIKVIIPSDLNLINGVIKDINN